MTSKTSTTPLSQETLTVVAAFTFVAGLLFYSSSLMVGAALLLVLRLSLYLVSFARPVPAHFRKHGTDMRYSR